MHRIVIPIKGMHCRSCEILIADKLKEIDEVKKVYVSFSKGQAEIISSQKIPLTLIEQVIGDAGYEAQEESAKEWLNKDGGVYYEVIYSLIIVLLVYVIFKRLGIHLPKFASSSAGLPVVVLTGLVAGFSTCMTLVGGLILGVSARYAEKHPRTSPLQRFRPHLFFNVGRLLAFFILGGAIGLIGKSFQLSVVTFAFLIIIVAIAMLVIGLQLTEISPRISNFSLTLPSSISRILRIEKHKSSEYSHANSAILGGITFFLPCGFTQAMQLLALSSGSFISGALIMSFFALGTTPGLLTIGGLTSIVKGNFARRFFRFAGLVVIFFAVFNLSNGLALAGFRWPSLKGTTSNASATVPIENGYQIVKMEQYSGGYKPNKFEIKQGIPVKWEIDSKDATSCAASIYSADLNIRRILHSGTNEIEFTPEKSGNIGFSCSMGMYRGNFIVDESKANDTTSTSTLIQTSSSSPQSADEQVLSATYQKGSDITPKKFTLSAGKPARLEIDVKDAIYGCMSNVAIPGLADNFEPLIQGQKTVLRFMPEAGTYNITCSMGSPRGQIVVN